MRRACDSIASGRTSRCGSRAYTASTASSCRYRPTRTEIRPWTAPKSGRCATIYCSRGQCGRQQGMTQRVSRVVRQLHQMLEGETVASLRDAQLLERFTSAEEEGAFA